MKFIVIMTLILSSNVWASAKVQSRIDSAQAVRAEKIDSLARDYFVQAYQKRKKSFAESLKREDFRPPGCDPHHPPQSPNECIDVVCNHLGSFGCDQQSEINQVADTCRGVDGGCINSVCSRLGNFGCDQMSEIKQVGTMCAGRVDSGCIENVCQRLGNFGCDQMSELEQVTKSCGGH